ncbi:unnamed protein product [Rhodiola kirilowii]
MHISQRSPSVQWEWTIKSRLPSLSVPVEFGSSLRHVIADECPWNPLDKRTYMHYELRSCSVVTARFCSI